MEEKKTNRNKSEGVYQRVGSSSSIWQWIHC